MGITFEKRKIQLMEKEKGPPKFKSVKTREVLKYITASFVFPVSDILEPTVTYGEVDVLNTALFKEKIKRYLFNLADPENSFWTDSGGIHLEEDFSIDYLDCESIVISEYKVHQDNIKDFLFYYEKKGTAQESIVTK